MGKRGSYVYGTWYHQEVLNQCISCVVDRSLLQHLPCRAFHPQLCIPPVGQLEVPWQRLETLALLGCVDEDALQVERRCVRLLVGADLHREESVAGTMVLVQRGVSAAYDDLHDVNYLP